MRIAYGRCYSMGSICRSMLVIHNDLSNAAVLVYSKLNIVCYLISVRCSYFSESIGFADDQLTLNIVSFVSGNPFLNGVAVLVNDY